MLVSRKTEIKLHQQIYDKIKTIDVSAVVVPNTIWVNGAPVCGKATHLISQFSMAVLPQLSDIILTMTKEEAKEIRGRLSRRHPEVSQKIWLRDVRTVASVLVNGAKEKYDGVFIDEAIGFVAVLTSVSQVYMIGDVDQIPYIDRDQICPISYSQLSSFSKVARTLKCSYRCPLDVAYTFHRCYDGLYSKNETIKSVSYKPYTDNVTVISKSMDNTLYLVHLQADKEYLIRQGYGVATTSKALTINEAQGLTFQHTVLIRMNSKPLLIK